MIERWDNRKMEARSCPVCGSRDQSNVFAEAEFDAERLDQFAFASRKIPEYQHHRLVVCPSCDLLYANPLPASDALADAYREAAFDSAEEARFASRTYARILAGILRQLPDKAAALDIGAGDGAFLEELLAAGFTSARGVEPSAAPVRAARAGLRDRIVNDVFRPEAFQSGSLSLITCFQTLEHVPDPLGLCGAAFRLLKPGGLLFVVSHDRKALANRVLGLKSPIMDIEHLQLFSKASVQFMLRAAGFSEVRAARVWNRYPLHYWMRLCPIPRRIKNWTLPRLRGSALGSFAVSIPAGNLVATGRKHCLEEAESPRS